MEYKNHGVVINVQHIAHPRSYNLLNLIYSFCKLDTLINSGSLVKELCL